MISYFHELSVLLVFIYKTSKTLDIWTKFVWLNQSFMVLKWPNYLSLEQYILKMKTNSHEIEKRNVQNVIKKHTNAFCDGSGPADRTQSHIFI